MTFLVIACCALLLTLLVGQAVPVLQFVRRLQEDSAPRLRNDQCPPAAVVLCLRGCDPFLVNCLNGLMEQDYPDYEVRIIIDSDDDPAWPVVRAAEERHPQRKIVAETLRTRLKTCALKCSSLLQACAELPHKFEVVATIDADTIPHRTWLRELVTPLTDRRVGAAAGNRWYMPNVPTLGSLIRYVWNCGAVVQMYRHHYTWGGSAAIRTKALREAGIINSWRKVVSDDVVVAEQIMRHGYRIAFVPSLMMVNRETCSLAGAFNFLWRQAIPTRLYHTAWPAIAAHGIISSIAPVICLALLAAAVVVGTKRQAYALGVTGGLYLGTICGLIAILEMAVRKIIRRRCEPTEWLQPRMLFTGLLALLMTQIAFCVSIWRAGRLQVMEWRGIHYRVMNPYQIQRLDYQPFTQSPATANEHLSI